MAGFTFRLYLEDGNDIGTFETAVPDWSVGMEFFNRDHNEFRILDIVHSEALGGDEFSGAFIVTPVELAEPS
jgi:hypothetical protein